MKFKDKIKKLRLDNNLTQEDLLKKDIKITMPQLITKN